MATLCRTPTDNLASPKNGEETLPFPVPGPAVTSPFQLASNFQVPGPDVKSPFQVSNFPLPDSGLTNGYPPSGGVDSRGSMERHSTPRGGGGHRSSAAEREYDVPFFTVANYAVPVAPETYEYAVPSVGGPQGSSAAVAGPQGPSGPHGPTVGGSDGVGGGGGEREFGGVGEGELGGVGGGMMGANGSSGMPHEGNGFAGGGEGLCGDLLSPNGHTISPTELAFGYIAPEMNSIEYTSVPTPATPTSRHWTSPSSPLIDPTAAAVATATTTTTTITRPSPSTISSIPTPVTSTPYRSPSLAYTATAEGASEVDCAFSAAPGSFIRRVYGSHDKTPVGCIHAASGVRAGEDAPVSSPRPRPVLDSEALQQQQGPPAKGPKPKRHDETPVRGCVGFVIDNQVKKTPAKTKSKKTESTSPRKKQQQTTARSPKSPSGGIVREVSGKGTKTPEDPQADAIMAVSTDSLSSSMAPEDFVNSSGKPHALIINTDVQKDKVVTAGEPPGVAEPGGVKAGGDKGGEGTHTSSSSSDVTVTPRTPRTPRATRASKSREPSFCLELDDDNYPQTEAEYVALLHSKILEAQERQLLPLKEDLADWLSKSLGVENLSAENLVERLDNGVIICHLANLITQKARDARNKGTSTLEVPSLPYRTWGRARSGTFFARDNITNFLRFCRRLGVHDNLLFETEDLVCHTGVRGVVLCLLEVGRLAQNWWGIEPPGIVKLEREMDGEEWSGRSDSGYSNTSSPPGSTLALHLAHPSALVAPQSEPPKPPRPRSAPGHLPLIPRLVLPGQSTHTQTDSSLPGHAGTSTKPIPPPKPASIRRAVSNLAKRPTSFPTGSRGWSGAKTTPTTPVTTPTHAPKSRLPTAKTPVSGRTTPNTTPPTPTHCRRYLASLHKAPTHTSTPKDSSRPSSRPNSRPPSRSPSVCSRLQDCFGPTDMTDSPNKGPRSELDNKVLDIAKQTRGLCGCHDSSCTKNHVKRVADGKYDIGGKNIFVRLLKGKHVMVRVGGGWDTLEHYLLRHDPTQVRMFKMSSAEPYLHIRAKYRSPTPTKSLSSRSSPPGSSSPTKSPTTSQSESISRRSPSEALTVEGDGSVATSADSSTPLVLADSSTLKDENATLPSSTGSSTLPDDDDDGPHQRSMESASRQTSADSTTLDTSADMSFCPYDPNEPQNVMTSCEVSNDKTQSSLPDDCPLPGPDSNESYSTVKQDQERGVMDVTEVLPT